MAFRPDIGICSDGFVGAKLVVHFAKRSVNRGKDFVGFQIGQVHRRTKSNPNGPGARVTAMDRPCLERSDNDGGNDRHVGFPLDQCDAFFDFADLAVGRSRTFRIDIQQKSILEALNALPYGLNIAMTLAHGESAQQAQKPGKRRIESKQFFLGHVTERPVHAGAQDNRVEIALMVGNDQGAAMRWDVLQAGGLEVEEPFCEESRDPPQQLPYDRTFFHRTADPLEGASNELGRGAAEGFE
jgi:hypothetical protein